MAPNGLLSPEVDLSQGWLQASDLIRQFIVRSSATSVCPWLVLLSLHPFEKNLLSGPLFIAPFLQPAPSQTRGRMYSQEDPLCCFSKEQFW